MTMVRWAGDAIALEDIERRVDDAAFDPDRWTDVAEDITALFPGVKIVFQALYNDTSTHCTLVNVGWAKSDADKYLEHFGNINPWVESWRSAAVGVPVTADHALPRSELVRTEFYNDWLRIIDEADGATGLKLVQDRDRLANVAVHYDAKRSDEIHAVLARALRRLGPRMARSLEANRLLAGKEATRQMRPMIDRFRDAAIAVDRTGRIVAANAMAETLLFETGILRTGPRNMLHFVAADAERTFRQHLAAILGATIAACSLCEDMRTVQDSRMHVVSLLAVGSGLDRRSYGSFLPIHYDETLCLLIIRETTILVSARDSSLEGLDRYKLTRSEARVVMALCEGGSMREIAARLDIAYETLRTHLKRIYEKTGARSQRDLVRLFVGMA